MAAAFQTHQLPGTLHVVPKDQTCDKHEDRPAVRRVQGETDSFGCEVFDLCAECWEQYREEMAKADTSGTCEWCKTVVEKLRPQRDWEEGMHGPVYYVCKTCADRQRDEALRYLEEE